MRDNLLYYACACLFPGPFQSVLIRMDAGLVDLRALAAQVVQATLVVVGADVLAALAALAAHHALLVTAAITKSHGGSMLS